MDPIAPINTTSDAVGKLPSLKDKLRANPSAAAAALAEALGEVDKTYFAIESELARGVALAVNPGALEKDVTPVAELEVEGSGLALTPRAGTAQRSRTSTIAT